MFIYVCAFVQTRIRTNKNDQTPILISHEHTQIHTSPASIPRHLCTNKQVYIHGVEHTIHVPTHRPHTEAAGANNKSKSGRGEPRGEGGGAAARQPRGGRGSGEGRLESEGVCAAARVPPPPPVIRDCRGAPTCACARAVSV